MAARNPFRGNSNYWQVSKDAGRIITYLFTYLLHGAESFLRSYQVFSQSRNYPHLINTKVHHRSHKCPPSVPILSQIDLVHITTSHFLKIHLNIIPSSMARSPKWSVSFRFPHQNPVYASPLPHTHYMRTFFMTLTPEQYWMRSTDYAPHYVVFSTPLSPRPPQAQIFSSAPYSQTPSAYVPPSVSATKFHTHTKQQAKLQFCIS